MRFSLQSFFLNMRFSLQIERLDSSHLLNAERSLCHVRCGNLRYEK